MGWGGGAVEGGGLDGFGDLEGEGGGHCFREWFRLFGFLGGEGFGLVLFGGGEPGGCCLFTEDTVDVDVAGLGSISRFKGYVICI